MLDVIASLAVPNTTKIVLISLDGISGLPHPETGLTELETARMPHMAALTRAGVCGSLRHVAPGVSPGSVPGHLGLLGYDPLEIRVALGILEALGIGFPLWTGDLAARGNFCTVDHDGLITDRRAGRITTEACARLVDRLRSIRVPGVEVFLEPVLEHRFLLVMRGQGLSARLSESDPQGVGRPPLPVEALEAQAEATAVLVNAFVADARRVLGDEPSANMVLLRGFDRLQEVPRFPDLYRLRAAAIAQYSLRGLAQLLGVDVLKTGRTLAERVATLREHWGAYDFFLLHYKDPDKAGEDGNFAAKVQTLERFDAFIPQIQSLGPDVLVVTGDHSTPSILRAHGWDPVPVLVSSRYALPDGVTAFTERACAAGNLGLMPAQHLMPIVMAHALRLAKFGA